MNAREKILALAVGGVALAFGGFFGAKMLVVKPLREIDKKTAALRAKLYTISTERRAYFTAEDQVKQFVQRTFADTEDQASAQSGEMITKIITQSGLREADFSRTPAGPRVLRAGLGTSEIGWSVTGEGPLANVVNLVFLLQESPHLHRLENLVVSAGDAPGHVRVRFRYLTLVVKPAPAADPLELSPRFALDSPERRLFDSIVLRDILRPYIKRQPAPRPGGNATPPGTPPSTPGAPPGPESFRIVSLSEWMGRPEIHVRDLTNQKTLRYQPGDALAGGIVVMVDYRPFPMPGNEALKSFSRVILRIGEEFWAIERGKTLADKYKLAADRLPEQLAKLDK